MNPRTYLQQRILDRLNILTGLVKIEEAPTRETRAAWGAAGRIIRTYFDIYPESEAGAVPSPLSSPKRQTHHTPPEKKVDPEELIV